MRNNIPEKTSKISKLMNELIYDIGRGVDRKELHNKAISILLGINDIKRVAINEAKDSEMGLPSSSSNLNEEEITKIKRKLLIWSEKPKGVPAQMLTHYFELEQEGKEITKDGMKAFARCEGIPNIDGNFRGLTKIYPKNHGKIFDIMNGKVTLWEPVQDYIKETWKL